MTSIPSAYKKIPMMFRAQIPGRSQLQYLDPQKKSQGEDQDVERWVDEWIDQAEFISEENTQDIATATYQAKSYDISWRFVTNGGQDDGMLRPVIGASGIPFYPGSSMKGAFRQACQQAEDAGKVPPGTCNYYCGDELDITPGLLRFQGAYPINDWTEGLLDLVHPQQGWQLMTQNTNQKPQGESPYAQISLYKPRLRFAISSPKSLSTDQWAQIWEIWQRALAMGLGSKVSTGYGQINQTSHPVLFRAKLKGQGQAAKLIDGSGEFRPNIFRAALRGHALRIFGGLTDSRTAEQLVEDLLGGIQQRDATVGLLGFQFQESNLEIKSFGSGNYAQPAYKVEGELTWFLAKPLADSNQEAILKKLVAKLMQFAMIFGGFGKSWRRADHRKFFPDYYENGYKALIGCHWQWLGENSQRRYVKVRKLDQVGSFLDGVRATAKEWIQSQNKPLQENQWANNWRESWHPSNVQVWGRIAEDADNSIAVRWFHQPYQERIQNFQLEKTIYNTHITGRMGQISLICHRMYPAIKLLNNPEDPNKPIVRQTPKFLELITIFPDNSPECRDFLNFLKQNPEDFQQLWGN
ncbi:RAMP superfamily protein [Planktothrix sp. FACHB-1365]|uniref:RAMP superfamily protein n=1 Tax=Planktothrix sp. FACHB-1365 TaxID=2692855 RepID=UPI001685B42D|nr:RAMP superfamily protein [Planktothrix sp. FACHB-1365]MBD2482820.1 RAMP superfamily protein [Planktothrix sp. FACHB-1365]